MTQSDAVMPRVSGANLTEGRASGVPLAEARGGAAPDETKRRRLTSVIAGRAARG